MRREYTMRSEKGKERTNARGIKSTSSVSRNAQPRFAAAPSEYVHERAARRRLDIQGGGRGRKKERERMGRTSPRSFHLRALPLGIGAEREREPPIFSYRILVCVHARRAINGKILESRSRNPGHAGLLLPLPRFSWVGFTITIWIGADSARSRSRSMTPSIFPPVSPSLSFRSLSRSRPSPTFLLTTYI